MGARPPTNGDDEPESIEFGIAAVDARLKRSDLSFPATHAAVERELGGRKIPYDIHDNGVEIGTILDEVDSREFESRRDLMNRLHPAFEAYRTRHGTGVVSQVRSLLPF